MIVVYFAALLGVAALAQTKADMTPTWTDPATGLMWARNDNGIVNWQKADMTWQMAANYCQNLSLGSYSGWRLPTIDELAAIYDKTQNDGTWRHWHIKGGIQISGWSWSNSAGNASGEAWAFLFFVGGRTSTPLGYFGGGRALCVRRSGE